MTPAETPSPIGPSRRTVLTSALGSLTASALVGTARSATRTTTDDAAEFSPLGSVAITSPKETVVSQDGTTAFVANTDAGFVCVDLTNPASPSILHRETDVLGDFDDGPLHGIFDVKRDGDQLLVSGPGRHGTGGVNGVAVFDVSDPSDPTRVAAYQTDFSLHNAFIEDQIVYLPRNAIDRSELVMVDVSDAPTEVGRFSIMDRQPRWSEVPRVVRNLHDLWVQDGIAYLAHWDAGTWIVDVADPAAPVIIAHIEGQPLDELTEIDASEARARSIQLPGNHHVTHLNDDASLLAIGFEAWAGSDGTGDPGGIDLWDVSTLGEPEQVGHVDPPPTPDPTLDGLWTTAHNFELRGDRLYTSWYRGGVRVFDVADPSAPRELAAWRDPGTTSFWTAQLGVPGEFFVAPSRHNPSEPDGPGALYTFPDTATVADRTATGQSPSSATTGERGTTPTLAHPAHRPDALHPGATTTSDGAETNRATTGADGPGFGGLAALCGVGLGAWLDRRWNGGD
jgi:hypothetical protein